MTCLGHCSPGHGAGARTVRNPSHSPALSPCRAARQHLLAPLPLPRSSCREWAAGCRPRNCGGKALGSGERSLATAYENVSALEASQRRILGLASEGSYPTPCRDLSLPPSSPSPRIGTGSAVALRGERCGAGRVNLATPGQGEEGAGPEEGIPGVRGGARSGFPGPPGGGGGLSPLAPAHICAFSGT